MKVKATFQVTVEDQFDDGTPLHVIEDYYRTGEFCRSEVIDLLNRAYERKVEKRRETDKNVTAVCMCDEIKFVRLEDEEVHG